MSSPFVETVRTIPLIIERNPPAENEEFTGYPFDREDREDRDGYLRSQLDDIAKRHPEFAEHLGNFAQRDRQRPFPSSDSAGSPRRFPRHLDDRFERFGFPFDREDFDPEYYTQQFHQPNQDFQQSHSQQHPTYQQAESEQASKGAESSQPPPSYNSPPTSEPDRCNLQQSNTFDLGRGQEPVNDRNQRSMSAPPSENSPESNQSQYTENMQSHSNAETKTSHERIIPIHIEGRDEPVLPKNIPPTYSQPHHAPAPQPERIFGKPTEHFTQFIPNERDGRFSNNRPQGFVPEEHIRQQRFQPQQSAPPRRTQEFVPHPNNQRGEIPIPVQREAPQKYQEQQRSASPQVPTDQPRATPPPPSAKALTPIEQIQMIQKDVLSLMAQVEAFSGKTKDKQYLYLDEMLTRNLIKLDNIDTQGQDTIRTARKEAIKCIEKAISILEAKTGGGAQTSQEETKMDIDESSSGEQVAANSQLEENEKQKEVEPMDQDAPQKPSDNSENVAEQPINEKVTETAAAAADPLQKSENVPMELSTDSPKGVDNDQPKPNEEASADEKSQTEQANTSTDEKSQTEQANASTDEKSQTEQANVQVVQGEQRKPANPDDKKVEGPESEQAPAAEVNTNTVNNKVSEGGDKVNEQTITADSAPTPAEGTKVETDDKKDKKDKKKGKKKVEKKDK